MPSKRGPIILGILILISLGLLTQFKVDNRRSRLLDQRSPAARAYERFEDQFGGEDMVVVAITGKPLFEFDALDAMVEASDRLAKLPRVKNVYGIPTIFLDTFGGEDAEALEEEMTTTPFYEGLFLSPNHEVAGLMLELGPKESPKQNVEFAQKIDDAVKPLRDYGFRVEVIGDPIFGTIIDKLTQGESLRMFPIACAASLLVLIWLLRSIRATGVVLACGASTLVLTLGGMIATGHTFNMVTISLPLILWVLAIANCIHIVSRYQHNVAELNAPGDAARKTLFELRFGCTLSALTTAFGFLSLFVADVSSVRELGMYTAMGMIISLIVNLTLAPSLLVAWKVSAPPRPHEITRRGLDRLGNVLIRHPIPVLVVCAAFIAAATYYATKVRANPDDLEFLPDNHPVAMSYKWVAENLTGLYTLEIVVDTPDGWVNPEYWPYVQELTRRLEDQDIVARVYSPLDFLKKINQWDNDFDPAYYRLPDSQEDAQRLLDQMTDQDRRQLDRFIAEQGHEIRVSALITSMNSEYFDKVIKVARTAIADFPPSMHGVLTGMAVRMHQFKFGLLQTQITSYSVAFLLVFASIWVGLRSFRMTVLSIIPNIIPLLAVFTAMGALGIRLDVATVMVSSISLGIAVDDTVHFLVGYRRHRSMGDRNFAAIGTTLTHVGPALIVTTITACIGFFTLTISAFIPIANFGLLAGIAMFAALLADLLLLPSILALAGDAA